MLRLTTGFPLNIEWVILRQITTYSESVASEDDVSIYGLPEGFLDYDVTTIDENCPTNVDPFGTIELKFENDAQSGRYLLVSQEDGKEYIGTFENVKIVKIEVPAGMYNLTIFDPRDFQHLIPGSIEVKKTEDDLIQYITSNKIINFL